MKRCAAITMSRNDTFFLSRWIQYYGRQFGTENLYIYLDGLEQPLPNNAGNANITKLQHTDMPRLAGDKYRIKLLNDLAKQLFVAGYDIVIGCDTDEFLIVDPNTNKSLKQYLSELKINTSVSGLGLDVAQDTNLEKPLDKSKPFLQQRGYALLSTRYTKPVVLAKPAHWGSGFHRVLKHNFHIDRDLYLLHFGMVDLQTIENKKTGRDATWVKHIDRQIARTFGRITKSKNRSESNIKIARFIQRFGARSLFAWNKPSMHGLKLITAIPKRFKKSKV